MERLNNLRTPEIHYLSRVRANFTNAVLQPIDQCVEPVNLVLTYVFDHFIAAIAVRSPISYDVVARTPISLEVIHGSGENEDSLTPARVQLHSTNHNLSVGPWSLLS